MVTCLIGQRWEIECSLSAVAAYKKAPTKCSTPYCRNARPKDRKVCPKCRLRAWRAKCPERAAYNNVRGSAVKRGIGFSLTFAEFLGIIQGTGYIEKCGNCKGDLHLDRIDAAKGYEIGNLQVITCSDNIAKGNVERHYGDVKECYASRRVVDPDVEPF